MKRSTRGLFIFLAVQQASLSLFSLLQFLALFHPSRYLKHLLFHDSQKGLLFSSRRPSNTKQPISLIVWEQKLQEPSLKKIDRKGC